MCKLDYVMKYAVTIQFGLKMDVVILARIGRSRRYLVGSQ